MNIMLVDDFQFKESPSQNDKKHTLGKTFLIVNIIRGMAFAFPNNCFLRKTTHQLSRKGGVN